MGIGKEIVDKMTIATGNSILFHQVIDGRTLAKKRKLMDCFKMENKLGSEIYLSNLKVQIISYNVADESSTILSGERININPAVKPPQCSLLLGGIFAKHR